MQYLKLIFLLSFPLIFMGIFHMLLVKLNWFSSLAHPLHLKYFGKNKTWRGFVLIPALSILGLYFTVILQSYLNLNLFPYDVKSILGIGAVIGLLYALGELPNSYWKRSKQILEGETPAQGQILHIIIDQIDSIIPCAFFYYFYFDSLHFSIVPLTIALGLILHFLINNLLFLLRLRKRPY